MVIVALLPDIDFPGLFAAEQILSGSTLFSHEHYRSHILHWFPPSAPDQHNAADFGHAILDFIDSRSLFGKRIASVPVEDTPVSGLNLKVAFLRPRNRIFNFPIPLQEYSMPLSFFLSALISFFPFLDNSANLVSKAGPLLLIRIHFSGSPSEPFADVPVEAPKRLVGAILQHRPDFVHDQTGHIAEAPKSVPDSAIQDSASKVIISFDFHSITPLFRQDSRMNRRRIYSRSCGRFQLAVSRPPKISFRSRNSG